MSPLNVPKLYAGAQRASVSCTTFVGRGRRAPRGTEPGSRAEVGSRWRRSACRCALAVAILSMVLVGCADEGDEREFAPNPRATGPVPIGSPGLPVVGPGTSSPTGAVAPVPTLTARDLLRPRGAPSRFYFLSGRSLHTFAGEEEGAVVLVPAAGDRSVVAYSPSPSGDRVAVLVDRGSGTGGEVDLLVLDGEGAERRRIEDVGGQLSGVVENASPRAIDWSPQGDRLLLVFGSGELASVGAEGTDEPVLLGAVAGATPMAARWSPTGEAVAVLAGEGVGSGEGDLVLLEVGATPSPAQPVVSLGSGRRVSAVSWAPDGRALLIVERPATGGPMVAGDLWQIGVDGGGRRVVASAGAAGPAARVETVRPSPTGAAVAYTIAVAEGMSSRFHSLRVKELESGRVEEVAVPGGEAVTDLFWTSRGLVFRTVPAAAYGDGYDGGPFVLYRVDGEGGPRPIVSVSADDLGTPFAAESPVAEGEAPASTDG